MAILSYQNRALQAYQEVESQLALYARGLERKEKLLDSAVAADRALSLAQTQYVQGQVDYTRVLDAQEAVLTQQRALIENKGEIALALIGIYRSLGSD